MKLIKKDNQSQTDVSVQNPFSLIDRFLDNRWDPFDALTPSLFGRANKFATTMNFPKVDVTENEKEIRVIANLPGIDPDNVSLEVGDDYLSLCGRIEKEQTQDDKDSKVYRYEREYGEFRREFALPARVNKDAIVAKAKNGVLTITLPKSEEEKKTKVKIEAE